MLLDLVTLSWVDIVTAALPIMTVIVIQLLNSLLTITPPTTANPNIHDLEEDTTSSPVKATGAAPTTKLRKLNKQQSEHCEDSSLPSCSSSSAASSANSSPNSSARNSINAHNNGSIIPIPISPPTPISTPTLHHVSSTPDCLTDEFHEDEDTLSLDNLFPCDQSEIYASKKISFIIDELIQTESNYVNNMRRGLENYVRLMTQRQDLPDSLQGEERQRQLFGNIEEILLLHEQQVLPMMLRNQHDLKMLFDEFAAYFHKNQLYCYVLFMMHKKSSMQMRQEQREWLQNYQNEIRDKLGIDSFLVQPIQRLTRYPLLLQQFISEFYKSGINCKPVVMSVCKLETRMRRLLEVVNQAEEISSIDEANELNLHALGYFRKSTEFDAYHHRSRKKQRVKAFLFDGCLVCTEVRKRRLVYRQHYYWELLELQLNHSKSITLLLKQSNSSSSSASSASSTSAAPPTTGSAGTSSSSSSSPCSSPPSSSPLTAGYKEEYDFLASDAITVTQWMRCARAIIDKARVDAAQRGKFSLPMDLVLGVAFAIWFIWHFL